MDESDLRTNELHSELLEPKLAKSRGKNSEGVDGGADIVEETGESQPCGAAAAARSVGGLNQQDSSASGGEGHCGSEAIRAAADDDEIWR
jgi:hypothetical protein